MGKWGEKVLKVWKGILEQVSKFLTYHFWYHSHRPDFTYNLIKPKYEKFIKFLFVRLWIPIPAEYRLCFSNFSNSFLHVWFWMDIMDKISCYLKSDTVLGTYLEKTWFVITLCGFKNTEINILKLLEVWLRQFLLFPKTTCLIWS